MRRFVVDTSALIRLFVPDGPLPPQLEPALEECWRAEAELLVPELVFVEAGQVLRKKEAAGHLTVAEVDEILDALLDLPLCSIGHRELLADAVALARARGLTVYDALFVVLAARRGAELISADARQVAGGE
jgi:predicted nucleic acid-binding protein